MADIYNTTNNTLLAGTAGDDYIVNGQYSSSDGMNVTIDANAGNDNIDNRAASVTINAGTGNDSIYNHGSSVSVNLDDGDDTLSAWLNDDYNQSSAYVTVNGGAGNDSIDNHGHHALIDGGAGNDTLYNYVGDDNGTHEGYEANYSTIRGGGDDDYIANLGHHALIEGNDGNDVILTNNRAWFDDEGDYSTLSGGAGNDSIYNNHGNSVIIDGGDGDDLIDSSQYASNVTIIGGQGNDVILNSSNTTTLEGSAGDDDILNGGENVSIIGGDGNDKIDNATGTNVTINGNVGNDTISNTGTNVLISGDDGDDFISLSWEATSSGGESLESWVSKNSTLIGGAGNDSIEIIRYSEDGSLPENNVIQYTEGDGHDTVWGYSANNSLQINSASPWSSVVSGNNIVITVGDGSITLVDAATSSGVNINGVTYPVDTTATTPADTSTATTPADTSTATTPADTSTATTPADTSTATTPADTSTATTPADTSTATTPADTSTATTPADTSTATTPADTSTATTPADTSTATTPADTSTTTTPADTSTATTPADTSTATTPAVEPTPVTPVNPAAPTDVVFIIDNTSSMREEIDNVKTAIISFAKNLANSGAGYRLGLVEFGDLVDSQIKVYGFTDRDTFISWVDGITLTDGADLPESGLEAITVATTMDFMPGSNKRFIVVTDDSFHNLGEDGDGDPSTYFQTEAVQALLAANAVKMDVVGTTGTDCQTEYEPLANATGGKFYDINKLAGGEVLEEIADDILGRAHVNINLDTDSVPEGTTSGVFVVTPVLNAAGAVVPASSDATFKTAAEEGDYVVGYVVGEKAYMAVPDSPWRQIVTIPDNWIVSGTYQDDALNVTGSNAVISGSLGKDNISINEDAVNTTLVDVSELQNGSDTLSFSKRVTPGTLQQNFTGGGTALYTTDSDGELDFVINLQGIAALDESLLNCEVSNAGKPNTIRELIYGEITVPIFNDTLEGRIMFAQWGYGFTPPEGNPLFVDPLATSADLAADFGSPTLDDIAPANFAVTQDDFTAQNFNADFAVKQANKFLAASKPKF